MTADHDSAPDQAPTQPAAVRLAWLWALLPLGLLIWHYDFLTDDSFISFRYARNAARGLGFVYNPGVNPPVEGYTEFGWVLWLSFTERMGLPVELVSRLSSALAGLLLLAMTLRSAARINTRKGGGVIAAALFLATLPSLAVWSTGGMGTMPYALCVMGMFLALFEDGRDARPWSAALWGAGALLLRADGFTWVAGFVLLGLALGPEQRRRASLRTALACAAVFAAHLLWRWNIYGDWLPNTARAKIGMSSAVFERGALYLASQCLVMPAIPVALILALLFGNLRLGRSGIVAIAGVLGCATYAVITGGDFMAYGRFLVPALPLLGWVLARSLDSCGLGLKLGAACGVLLASTSLATTLDHPVVPQSAREQAHFRYNLRRFESEESYWGIMQRRGQRWAVLGRLVAEHTSPGESLVLGGIGAIGYYSDLFIYDRYGLVTREVALRELPEDHKLKSPGHDKGVGREFFLDKDPTWYGAYVQEPEERKPSWSKGLPKETFPIPPEHPASQEYAPGSELVLVRPRRTGRPASNR